MIYDEISKITNNFELLTTENTINTIVVLCNIDNKKQIISILKAFQKQQNENYKINVFVNKTDIVLVLNTECYIRYI